LGDVARVDRVVVRWPSGAVSTLADLEVNRLIVIEEPEGD
jgi:hypothetical protein